MSGLLYDHVSEKPAVKSSEQVATQFDIAVIGGGLAGLTAAHHAAQGAASVAHVVGLEPLGGLVCNVGVLSGFPSVNETQSGIDLALAVASTNRARGVVQLEDHATSLAREETGFRIALSEGEITARQVIAATGARLRMLDVPGAAELTGRGVSQCGWCDGALQKGR
ncbi:MAG: FAD-dependent oxidoreductase, partial [Alphaproteobacteria bacterium]|nr:FAD-dependent oxidoreductase [Alphaproteobacteria bacterium]